MANEQTVAVQMEELLAPAAVRFLRAAGALATRQGLPLFLVGGSVRDLLLDRPVLDLDLVVEGDAPRLAAALAEEQGGAVTARSQFGTAKLKVGDLTLDLATARRETYAHPGALPTVHPGSLADDQARRDFTINAVAASLNDGAFGRVQDPFDGRADLESKRVRILHAASFADDATRIVRAIRYEQRLGFRMDADTESHARVDAHYLDTISGDRLRRELERTFQEPAPEASMSRGRDLGVLRRIHPALDWPEGHSSALQRRRAEGGRVQPLHIAALLATPLATADIAALAKRLNASRRWGRVLRDAGELRGRLPALAMPDLPPSGLAAALRGLEPAAVEAWAMLAESDTVRKRLLDYACRLRHVRPDLDGHDLEALGVPKGPAIGRLLRELLEARLDGMVSTREEEEAFVRRAALG